MGLIKAAGLAADSPAGVPLIGYDNIVTSSNISSSTESATYPVTNLTNSATHLKWQGAVNTGDEYITINAGGMVSYNYVAIAKHNLGSSLATVSVEVSDSNSPPNSPPTYSEVITPQAITSDDPIIFRFATTSAHHVRIRIQAAEAVLPEIAVLYVGQLLVLERSIKVDVDHVPITYGRRTTVANGMSESGNFLGRITVGEYRESKAEFSWFTPTFYRASIDPFIDTAINHPFFWTWAPDDYPAEVGFVWLTDDVLPTVHPITKRIALTLSMRGIA